jgi:hypothetical protein
MKTVLGRMGFHMHWKAAPQVCSLHELGLQVTACQATHSPRGWGRPSAFAHSLVRAVAPPAIPGVPTMALWSAVAVALI